MLIGLGFLYLVNEHVYDSFIEFLLYYNLVINDS